MRLKVKSQIHDKEARQQGILDDCGPAATAAAIGWVTGEDLDVTAFVAEYTKVVGRQDKQGVSSAGATFGENIKMAARHGAKGTWPKSFEQVVRAAQLGAAIILNVQGPKGYPVGKMSAWTRKWIAYWTKKDPKKVAKGFGHYVTVVYCDDCGWQYADPTMTGKGKEAEAFLISLSDFEAMASGKGRAKQSTCVIITTAPKKKQPAPDVPPKGKEPLVPVPAPVAPTPAPISPAPVTPAPAKPVLRPIVAAVRRIIDRRFGRVAK
jgi:hypothetical protein